MDNTTEKGIVARYKMGESYISLQREYRVPNKRMTAILLAGGCNLRGPRVRKKPSSLSAGAPITVGSADRLASVNHRPHELTPSVARRLDYDMDIRRYMESLR